MPTQVFQLFMLSLRFKVPLLFGSGTKRESVSIGMLSSLHEESRHLRNSLVFQSILDKKRVDCGDSRLGGSEVACDNHVPEQTSGFLAPLHPVFFSYHGIQCFFCQGHGCLFQLLGMFWTS